MAPSSLTSSSRSWTLRPPASPWVGTLGARYLLGWCALLAGYALFGRGFAYVGLPPLFVGELFLALGLGVAAWERTLREGMSFSPAKALVWLMGWTAIRTLPYLSVYGLDAIRDAMIVGYGLYALIIAGLLVRHAAQLRVLIERYRAMVWLVPLIAVPLYYLFRQAPESIPTWPWAPDIQMIQNKPGDVMVHLTGVTAFVLLGFRRRSLTLLVVLVIGIAAAAVSGRGGMLGFALSMGALAMLKPTAARFGRFAYVLAVVVVLGLVVDTSGIRTNEGNRSVSVEQLWQNVQSLVGQSEQDMLATTTEWRLEWWGEIVDYTIFGPHFMTGKGFGVNLGDADGFAVDEEGSLRSPHNGHLTMLARGGVPGLLLWVFVHGLWVLALLHAWREARQAGAHRWEAFLSLCMIYWLAALINGSFDVYLEGPMGGIWFWSLFGIGLAATRLSKTHPHMLGDEPPEARDQSPERTVGATGDASPRWGWA